MILRGRSLGASAWPATALVTILVVTPTVVLASRSLRGDDVVEVWSRPGVLDAVSFSLVIGLTSTLVTLAVAAAPTMVIGRRRFRGRAAVLAVLTAPFVLPTVVVGSAFLALLPDRFDRTVWAVLAAHAFFNASVVIRQVVPLLESIDGGLVDAARTLGAGPVRAWTSVALPIVRPAVTSAAGLVFLPSATSFGVVRILGGPSRATIDVEIHRRAVLLGDLSGATVLAVAQTLVVAATVSIAARRRNPAVRLRRSTNVDDLPTAGRLARLVVAVSVAITVVPLAALVASSLRVGDAWSISGWRMLIGLEPLGGPSALRVDVAGALIRSLAIAVGAVALATPLGIGAAVAASREPRWRVVSMVPAAVSAIVVGFGIIVTYDEGFLDWRGSWWLVPAVHASVALPFVTRVVEPLVAALPRGPEEAAATLGADRWTTWRLVRLPLLRPAVSTAAAFSGALSLGEFGATAFLARTDSRTLPVLVDLLVGRSGDRPFAAAMAASTLLFVITFALVLGVERRRSS